jgi:hypothetical protein
MRRQRATSADRLSQVIDVIALGRRTGLLSIERSDQAGLEEGDIYFVEGEPIYASTGVKSGRAALEALRTWGACRFAFLADIPRPTPNIGPEPRGFRPLQTGPLRPTGPIAHPVPPQPQRTSPGFESPPGSQRPGSAAGFPVTPQRSGSLFAATPPFRAPPYKQRPKRAPNAQDIPRLAASYHLSWAHRAILLLADGEHTVADLARVSGRPEEEVLNLLHDLVRLGLIALLSE